MPQGSISSGWTFSPAAAWTASNSQYTDSGPSLANWATSTAELALPSGTVSWQANMTIPAGAPSDNNSGVYVQSGNGQNAVFFAVVDNNSLEWSVTANGNWQGWNFLGSINPTSSHVYQITLQSNGTFSVWLDGTAKATGISAGPASVWTGGMAAADLYTQTGTGGEQVNTIFNNVSWNAPVVPAAPTNLAATAGNGQVTLTWTAAGGATNYNLYRGTSGGGETLLQSGLTGTSFTNTGLSNGTTYYYQVTAVNSSGESTDPPRSRPCRKEAFHRDGLSLPPPLGPRATASTPTAAPASPTGQLLPPSWHCPQGPSPGKRT